MSVIWQPWLVRMSWNVRKGSSLSSLVVAITISFLSLMQTLLNFPSGYSESRRGGEVLIQCLQRQKENLFLSHGKDRNFEAIFFSIACPTSKGGMQNGSSVGIPTRCARVFARLGARFACSVDDYQQKFLRRSSEGSLLRLHCWLGWSYVHVVLHNTFKDD